MKILVPVKRVPDYQVKVKLAADGASIDTSQTKWIVNPFDEIAVEEAIKLKEAGAASEVVVVGIGPEDVATQLRYTMAMGADSAVLVKTSEYVDSSLAAEILAAVFRRGSYGLIIMGKQAIDSDAGQTPQILAALLQLPQACFASKVVIAEGQATVTREVDGGLETLRIPLPGVISTDLRLNTPRYAPLPGIMKAKKKPLEELSIEQLGVKPMARVRIKRMTYPQQRQGGKKVASVEELVTVLQSEAKVL